MAITAPLGSKIGTSSAPRLTTLTSRYRALPATAPGVTPTGSTTSLGMLARGGGVVATVQQKIAQDQAAAGTTPWMPHTQGQNLFKPADPNAPVQDQPQPQDLAPPQAGPPMQDQPQPQSSGGGGGGGGGFGPGPSQQSDDDSDDSGYADTEPSYDTVPESFATIPGDAPLMPSPASRVTKGIFRRLWDWLFGAKDSHHGEEPMPRTQEEAVKELVDRARAGDQNAMAMIASVAEQVKHRNPVAHRSYGLLHKYIRENPAGSMGAEHARGRHGPNAHANYHALQNFRNRDTHATRITPRAAALSHGRLLTDQNLQAIHSRFGNESESDLFAHSMVRTHRGQGQQIAAIAKQLGPRAREVATFGADVATARAIQLVRMPDSQISRFDPVVGWELGE